MSEVTNTMSDFYKVMEKYADCPAKLTEELMDSTPGWQYARLGRVVNGLHYRTAYTLHLFDGTLIVTLVNLDEHAPGTGSFYISTYGYEKNVRTVGDLCKAVQEIITKYNSIG